MDVPTEEATPEEAKNVLRKLGFDIKGGVMSETYKIIRYYAPNQNRDKEVIKTGLTLEEARAYLDDPNTRKDGVYFDGYTNEHK